MAVALDFCRRRRRWLFLLATTFISGYGAYRLYHLPSVTRSRRQLARLLRAILSLTDAAGSSAETLTLISTDLNRFLRSDSDSDSDDLPSTLKQLSKIANSPEFSASISTVSEALTVGILRGYRSTAEADSGFSDRALDKLFSPAGSGFASVVVGNFARDLVLAFYSTADACGSSNLEPEPQWFRLICSDSCRPLIADCIQRFVGTAVAVFLDKTMGINPYDEFFSGLTNPKHELKARDVVVSVCNGAIETLVRTSHQVLTSSNRVQESSVESDRRSLIGAEGKEGGMWVDQFASTLAVPGNKSFVLDVTGRVTCVTVRSFLEFLLCKMFDNARRSVNSIHVEVVERGLEVVKYMSAKSMVITTICLALCMNLLARTRVLIPA